MKLLRVRSLVFLSLMLLFFENNVHGTGRNGGGAQLGPAKDFAVKNSLMLVNNSDVPSFR